MTAFLHYLLTILCYPADLFLRFLSKRYSLFRWFVIRTPEEVFNLWGGVNAWRAHLHAKLRVPAYRAHLSKAPRGKRTGTLFSRIPETDKDAYVRPYPTAARCLDGVIPFLGTVVDESSGSSGKAYNWVRSLRERQVSHLLVSHFVRYNIDSTKLFTINAFSMGSWATGLNMGLAMQKNGLVKNIGPDIDKILSTLEFWGTTYTYAICGYPPFLKHLLDTARSRAFPIHEYTLYGLVGGEGMSEGLRDYLQRDFKIVFSGYGATDLEIGIAGETPLSIAVRRAARENPELRKELFGDDPRLPMVFQYNPVSHFVEVNEAGELVFTITRQNMLSPRIRYNIHDAGGLKTLSAMQSICAKHGFEFEEEGFKAGTVPQLPFLWVFGRIDYTISIMGANVYPEDIEQSLYAIHELAAITHSFCLGTVEEEGNIRPVFSFEVTKEITPELEEQFQRGIVEQLVKFNADFKEAWHEHKETLVPVIRLYAVGQGPFSTDSGRIKQVRMMK